MVANVETVFPDPCLFYFNFIVRFGETNQVVKLIHSVRQD